MPLARIITEHAEEALELAIQLRSRGFDVETVAPGQVSEAPADLEIQLDACDAQEVVARVMNFSGGEESSIFIAPGTLDGSIRLNPDRFMEVKRELPRSIISEKVAELATASVDDVRDPDQPLEPAERPVELREPALELGIDERQTLTAESDETEGLSAPAIQLAGEDSVTENDSYAKDVVPDLSTISEPRIVPAPPIRSGWTPSPNLRAANYRSLWGSSLFWRVAIPAASLATLVVFVGSMWQQRKPAVGIPANAESQPSSSQKASPQTPGVSPTQPTGGHSDLALPSPPIGAAESTSSAQVAQPESTPTVAKSASPAKRSVKRTRVQAQHHTTAHSADSGLVAKDTVTYFDRKPAGSTHPPDTSAK
jgi:hypothetical protein